MFNPFTKESYAGSVIGVTKIENSYVTSDHAYNFSRLLNIGLISVNLYSMFTDKNVWSSLREPLGSERKSVEKTVGTLGK